MSVPRASRISVVHRAAVAAVVALVSAQVAFAAVDEPSRLVDGSFESGHLTLRLADEAPRPVVLGGWAFAGATTPALLVDPGTAFAGAVAARLRGSAGTPAALLQDVGPVGPGYVLRIALRREVGTQRLTLIGPAGEGDDGPLLELSVGAQGLSVRTPAGTWQLATPIEADAWRVLEVVADPRADVHLIALDGTSLAALPGVSRAAPRTLRLAADVDGYSSFLYDAAFLASLAEVELRALQTDVLSSGDGDLLRHGTGRVETAALALRRGSVAMAAAELRALRRLARRQGSDDVVRRADELLDLLRQR